MALNYTGKWGSTSDSPLSAGLAGLDEVLHRGQPDTITVSDPHLLFSGDYKRSGVDLILSKDGREHVVENYFVGEKRAALAAPDGAQLSGGIVSALTGHVQYAQASGAPDAAKVIGHVTKLNGNATAIRNGVSIVLNMGDNVHKGDVVQCGSSSSLGITFIDGTVFGLGSNARMVLNDMVYDPNGSSNSSFLTLVQGTITFVAGQTAKHGDMKVDTPVATMGIRGTACLIEMGFEVPLIDPTTSAIIRSIPVKFQVLQEADGSIGSYVLYAKSDLTYSNPVATINRVGEVTAFNANGEITNYQLTLIAPEVKALIDQTMKLFFPNYTPQIPGSTPADPLIPDNTIKQPIKFQIDKPTAVPLEYTFSDPNHPGETITKTIDVTITAHNTAPAITVSPVADKPSFLIEQQVVITDPDNPALNPNSPFNDVPQPYVPGSGKVLSATGPAATPAGLDLAALIHLDPATGAVSYDPASFAFLRAGDKVIVTIGFDASSGPDTVHQTLVLTIDGANDAPVLHFADIGVPQGGTVVLGAANIGVTDPDDASFTFLVSNVTHGRFQTTVDGVTWLDAAALTSAELASGHVRFVHDGSAAAPTFSIQADDGEAAGNLSGVIAGTVAFTDANSAPTINATSGALTELPGSGQPAANTVSGTISFVDADPADRPAVTASFTSFAYNDAQHHDLTSSLTAAQLAAVLAVEASLTVTPAPDNANAGSAKWTYSVADDKLDFLGAGETLILNYAARVDDAHGGVATTPISIIVTGVNDDPAIAAGTIANGSIDVPVAGGATNTLSPELAARLNTSGLIGGLANHTGYGILALAPGDDNSSGAIDITSVFGSAGLDFFGTSYTSLFINNNGNVTFRTPSGVFTPNTINAGFNNPIIAAFWADVDTRGHGAVYYDLDPADGLMTITWDSVGYFPSGTNKLNSFQLVLVNEGNGNFDIVYRYGDIQWTTGGASGGSNGLGGTPARAGYSAGDGVHYFELAQSGNQAALLALAATPGNTGIAGVDGFEVRGGEVSSSALSASGKINFSDVDLTDRPTISATFSAYALKDAQGNDVTSSLTAAQRAEIETVEVPLALSTGNNANNGSATWTYSIASSALRFLPEGYKLTLTYSAIVDDGHGGVAIQPITVTITGSGAANVAPLITTASLTISEGGTAPFTAANLAVTDPENTSFTFTVTNVTHGKFQTTANGSAWVDAATFTTADLNAGHVRFVHDGGELAPGFSIQANDGAAANNLSNVLAGTVSFTHVNDAPVITTAALTIQEGGATVLDASHIAVADPDNNSFVFTASNVSHGAFQVTTDGILWVAAATFTTADLNAGHVRFVHDGSEDAPTFSIQANDGSASNSLSSVVAGNVSFTHVNDAPVITHAALTISQGHTVTLTTADIDFADPDNSVVTYSVSNLSHGHFEIGVGNAADETTAFTSADVASGLVSFVDDGTSGTPAFSLTPNDGSIDGATVNGVVTFSAANYTMTSSEGVTINVTPGGATSGFVFPGAGNVTTPGIPEDRIAIGYDVDASHVVLDNAPLLGVHQMASLNSETHSSGGTTFVSTTLDAGHGVTLVQTIALASDANFFTTTIDITNNGSADISNLRFLRNFDPDQDVQAHNDYTTLNDVIQKPDGSESFAILSATGFVSHTTVAMVGLGAEWQGSVFGFTNTDPYATHAFDFPVDPNGARADLSLTLTSSLGTLTANGGHVEVSYLTTNNVATSGSNALFGTAGADTINGLGGDDLLIGLKGADIFAFNAASAGSGRDTIADFAPGVDKISLDYQAFNPNLQNDFSNWLASHATVSGSDVLIDLNVDGLHPNVDTILLKNVAIASLHAGDFIV